MNNSPPPYAKSNSQSSIVPWRAGKSRFARAKASAKEKMALSNETKADLANMKSDRNKFWNNTKKKYSVMKIKGETKDNYKKRLSNVGKTWSRVLAKTLTFIGFLAAVSAASGFFDKDNTPVRFWVPVSIYIFVMFMWLFSDFMVGKGAGGVGTKMMIYTFVAFWPVYFSYVASTFEPWNSAAGWARGDWLLKRLGVAIGLVELPMPWVCPVASDVYSPAMHKCVQCSRVGTDVVKNWTLVHCDVYSHAMRYRMGGRALSLNLKDMFKDGYARKVFAMNADADGGKVTKKKVVDKYGKIVPWTTLIISAGLKGGTIAEPELTLGERKYTFPEGLTRKTETANEWQEVTGDDIPEGQHIFARFSNLGLTGTAGMNGVENAGEFNQWKIENPVHTEVVKVPDVRFAELQMPSDNAPEWNEACKAVQDTACKAGGYSATKCPCFVGTLDGKGSSSITDVEQPIEEDVIASCDLNGGTHRMIACLKGAAGDEKQHYKMDVDCEDSVTCVQSL